jgi:hypothetical protein
MTKAQEIYASTLNLLGSDVLDPDIQESIDREHAEADPDFRKLLNERRMLVAN